jgi:chromosome segregation ATPase
MSEQQTFISRIGNWFKPRKNGGDQLPLMLETPDRPDNTGGTRSRFFKPWGGPSKRDQAIANLQNGFGALTDLMGSIRDNLEAQGRRQDELLRHLSDLPQMLSTLPESNKLQSETLKAIHVQMTQQTLHQEKLTEILDRVGETTSTQTRMLDSLRDNVDQLHKHDTAIVDNISSVGSAMQTLSRNSHTSAQVLETLRDNLNSRDGQIERILHKQAARFTTMLAVAIFLSIAALVAVAVVGYQLLNKPANAPAPAVAPTPAAEIRSAK